MSDLICESEKYLIREKYEIELKHSRNALEFNGFLKLIIDDLDLNIFWNFMNDKEIPMNVLKKIKKGADILNEWDKYIDKLSERYIYSQSIIR